MSLEPSANGAEPENHDTASSIVQSKEIDSSTPSGDSRFDSNGPSSLHATSIVFEVIVNVWKSLFAILFGAAGALQGGGIFLTITAVVGGWAIVSAVMRYCTFRYQISGGELRLKEGLIFRRNRAVPIRRIQNIDLVQNPLHRLLKVAEVRVETASGTEPEAVMRVLHMDQVERLRRSVFGESLPESSTVPRASLNETASNATAAVATDVAIAEQTSAESGTLVHRITIRQLMMAGMASNRGTVFLGVIFGFLFQFDWDGRFDWRKYREQLNSYLDWLPQADSTASMALYAVLAFFGLILLLRIFGICWYLQKFYDHTVTRQGDDLRIRCGLFTKVSATVPRKRIQFISVHRPFLYRWMGLASVRIETAGGAGSESEDATSTISRRWFLPVVGESDVNRILSELRPDLNWLEEETQVEWFHLSPRTGARLFRAVILGTLLLVAAGLFATRPWGWLLGVAGFPVLLFLARKETRARRYSRPTWGVAYQSGWIVRKLSLAFHDRIQGVALYESPFDRRWGMAKLSVDTAAAGPAEHSVEIRYLEKHVAEQQYRELQQAAALHRPAWH